MSVDRTNRPPAPGDIIWCTKLHEDELQMLSPQQMPGETATYRITGKMRPSLLLRIVPPKSLGSSSRLLIWYGTSKRRDGKRIVLSAFMTNANTQQTFCYEGTGDMKEIPCLAAWCNQTLVLGTMEKTAFDTALQRACRALNDPHSVTGV